ncbi:MAG: hypothetical protein ACFB00_13800 [Parvularculaceae bacterium]
MPRSYYDRDYAPRRGYGGHSRRYDENHVNSTTNILMTRPGGEPEPASFKVPFALVVRIIAIALALVVLLLLASWVMDWTADRDIQQCLENLKDWEHQEDCLK